MAPLLFFFFNDTATTEIYTLSLHDALPILIRYAQFSVPGTTAKVAALYLLLHQVGFMAGRFIGSALDRKSTRLNSSHLVISYAVFCFKKKNRPDLSTERVAV